MEQTCNSNKRKYCASSQVHRPARSKAYCTKGMCLQFAPDDLPAQGPSSAWERMQLRFKHKFAGTVFPASVPHKHASQEVLQQTPANLGQSGVTTHKVSTASSSSGLGQEAEVPPMRNKRIKKRITSSIQVKRVKWGKPNPKPLCLHTTEPCS